MVRSPSLYGVTAIVCSTPSRRIRNSIGLSPGFFEIVCAICDANTMRSPSIARITSSTLIPADSAGLPAESDATIGFASGSTPIAPTSNRAPLRVFSSVRSGRILRRCSLPLRSTVTSTSRSGREATAISRCSQVRTSAVPNLVMRSPRRRPAFSAGEPACTAPTTAGRSRNASTSAPCSSTNASRTTASTRFITGPAIRIWKRCHFDFAMNSSSAPVCGSSGFSPAIFT